MIKIQTFLLLLTLCWSIGCKLDEKVTDHIYNIVALGNTGVGKSSLLNMLAGENSFKVGTSIDSQTKQTTWKLHKYNGIVGGHRLRLIDTQGLSDVGGLELQEKYLYNMIEQIKHLDYISLFIICLDGTNPRFTQYMESMINEFKDHVKFPDFLENSVLVFNKWTSPNKSRSTELMRQYQRKFEEDYEISDIPCFFIDSNYNQKMLRQNDDGTSEERYLHPNIQAITADQSDKLMRYIINKKTEADVKNLKGIHKKTRVAATLSGAALGSTIGGFFPVVGTFFGGLIGAGMGFYSEDMF
jgi:small GTP-binding protein